MGVGAGVKFSSRRNFFFGYQIPCMTFLGVNCVHELFCLHELFCFARIFFWCLVSPPAPSKSFLMVPPLNGVSVRPGSDAAA